jgi:hypothetical protein
MYRVEVLAIVLLLAPVWALAQDDSPTHIKDGEIYQKKL